MNLILLSNLLFSLSAFATQFLAIGDTGKDNNGQRLVTDAMIRHCYVEKCDYGMLAGDNVYDAGMSSVDDPIIDRVFTKYYSQLPFPFYVSLGNHDYGKLSNDWKRGSYQLEFAKKNPQFILPHYFYYQEFDHMVLVVLDTTRLMWSRDISAQENLLQQALWKAQGKWVIALSHHPYLSNGKHGNAGNYEGVTFPSFVSGTDVKKFVEKNICGKVHVYISGHDHNLQLTNGMIMNCNTLFAVTGGGASTEEFRGKNQTMFQAEKLGFLSVVVEKDILQLRFFDEKNNLLHETKRQKSL